MRHEKIPQDELSFEDGEQFLDFLDHSKGLVVSINNDSRVTNFTLSKDNEEKLLEWLSARRK